ncbi:MAG: hypothetical protein KC550_00825 [Nanoarchaeota archaeon]|nr:hypothetical protein [Nanoarchaeota archaeon]
MQNTKYLLIQNKFRNSQVDNIIEENSLEPIYFESSNDLFKIAEDLGKSNTKIIGIVDEILFYNYEPQSKIKKLNNLGTIEISGNNLELGLYANSNYTSLEDIVNSAQKMRMELSGKEMPIGISSSYKKESIEYLKDIFNSREEEIYNSDFIDPAILRSSIKIWDKLKFDNLEQALNLDLFEVFVDKLENKTKYSNQFKLLDKYNKKFNTTIFSNENLLTNRARYN